MGFVEDIKWRGMLQDMTPEVESLLAEGMRSAYIGFDPTSDSLHIGNLVQIMFLVHFQKAGHKPYALVGGATGMIGDPSGKSQERNLLSEDNLRHNEACIKKQLERFLSFDEGDRSAEIVNNYDWYKDMDMLHFLREIGKHLTISYMMAKDSVKSRLETGISFTEFTYQLIQAYDFYYLNENRGVELQMGGSDQWGNITAGVELIRRKSGKTANAITSPLLTRADGSKFGKTASGDNIWLDEKKTSAYKFYQFWLGSSDEDVKKFNRIFSLKERGEILALEVQQDSEPHRRPIQNSLAEELTLRVHGEQALVTAKRATNILFGKSTKVELAALDLNTFLEIFEGVPQFSCSLESMENCTDIVDLLTDASGIFKSKGELRKLIKGNGLSMNKEKVRSPDQMPSRDDLIGGKYLLVQKGKKNYFLLLIKLN